MMIGASPAEEARKVVKFHFDALSSTHASGWAYSDGADALSTIEAWQNGRLIGAAPIDIPRQDVAADHGPNAARSGFRIGYRPSAGKASIEFRARTAAGDVTKLHIAQLFVADLSRIDEALKRPLLLPSPFPPSVAKILRAVSFSTPIGSGSDSDQENAVDLLIEILRSDSSRLVPDLVRYARFLRGAWSHMLMCERLFPEVNGFSEGHGSVDYFCKVSSPSQMISIANQLYVAKENGLAGALGEFGCFKGFCTAMLSTPCAELGIPMHVYDSFEGLPSCEGDAVHRAGQFRGDLDEVKGNVLTFGSVDHITFHKGFFSESLKQPLPPLMQIWMDVDLYSSALDMAPAFKALSSRGVVFSHKCEPWMFERGRVLEETTRSSGNVMPAIVDGLSAAGAIAIAGRFIVGNTGAVWRTELGVPVMAPNALMKLVCAVSKP